MNGHVGRVMVDCPECLKREGWQDAYGMKHAAQNIRHEAETEEELDLAELCDYIADAHKPDPENDNRCMECGEQWWQDTNIGVIQCQAFLDMRIEKNFWIMRKVWRMRAKWRAYS